jgi:hypothetical protein
MPLNPRKIINDAGIHIIIRRGNDSRMEVIEPKDSELVWGEWLDNAMKATSLRFFFPNNQAKKSPEVTLVDDGEKPWGIQMGGSAGNQRLIVGGSKDFNIRIKKKGDAEYFINFECIGGDFDGYNVNAITEFKINW